MLTVVFIIVGGSTGLESSFKQLQALDLFDVKSVNELFRLFFFF
jgi:hypothetical protein